jgi:glutathione S-transferase
MPVRLQRRTNMTDIITFYHHPMSRGRMVHWMLEECGAPYEVKLVNMGKGEHKAPGFTALNPMGKLPTIVHKGVVVTEVAAIITYLADAFPAAGLAPAVNDARRGAFLRWMFFGSGCIDQALIDKMFSRPAPERPGVLGYGSFDDTINAVTLAIKPGPYLLGSTFSAADLFVSAQLGWGAMVQAFQPSAEIDAYLERCRNRPSSQRVMAQSEEFTKRLQAA